MPTSSAPDKAVSLVYAQNLLAFTILTWARVVLVLFALDIGASAAQVGILISMLYLMSLLLSWPAGMLSDRYGARWLFVGSSAVCMLCMLAPYFWPVVPAMWVAAAGVGLVLALAQALGQTLVGMLSKPEHRTRNYANYSLVGPAANFIGPLLAGFFIDHAGFAANCLILAALAALATALMLLWGGLLPRSERRAARTGGMLSTLTVPGMGRILAITCISTIGFDSFSSFMPVYAHGVGVSASAIGMALSAFALSAFLARTVIARATAAWGEPAVLGTAFAIGAVAFFLVPASQNAWAMAATAFLFGLCNGCTGPIAMVLVYASSPPGRTGEAIGLRLTVSNAMRVVGPAVFGFTVHALGIGALFVASGALMCLGSYLGKTFKMGSTG